MQDNISKFKISPRKGSVKMKELDTSEWRFIEDDNRHFDPLQSKTQSTQHKDMCFDVVDQSIEQEMRETIIDDIRSVVTDKSNGENTLACKPEESNRSPKINRKENEEILTNLKEFKMETNPYLVLCNRLDEEEGIKMPSVEDKLKLAEDRLRVSVNNFCETCEELLETTDSSDTESSKVGPLLKPEAVHESFRPKVLEPGLLPPQTLSVSEFNKKPKARTTQNTELPSTKVQTRKKGTLKQGFYLPSDTLLTQDKIIDKLTPEEAELLNSTSTKAFLKFLEDRKKEPPKVLQDIQKKLQDTQKYEKQ
ncbi:hypothetical protein JTE90_003048 [Oedothorax gibbosus]|uniref:Uncharacterized protein n=1 Tax=Oedothorax gibbosus TaxID=931172 RepID=A0AAV6VC75_9ARAC|nr:hypothetical protein JTE90_003048 [Oedothorax gibbosus]